jgi:elongation factor 1 alpha-like protein
VDSSTGGFESGFDANGQTKEHALLVRSLGVNQLVVAVNKLDMVGWSQERFESIQSILTTYLTKTAGFRKDQISFVPVSGLSGANLRENLLAKTDLKWYSGPTLVDRLGAYACRNCGKRLF